MSTTFDVRRWATQAGIQTTGGFAVIAEYVTMDELQRFAEIAIASAGFDAADMATAAAQGFRDGAASVSAGSAPVATVFTMEALAPGGGVKYHATIHKALPAGTKLYTHPSPPEGMTGWSEGESND